MLAQLAALGDCAMADGESGAKALNASRMNSAGGLEFAPEIAAALSECVSSAELSWLALGYESKKALKLLATGSSGGYAALKPHLADDAVVYSAFKVACAGSQKLVFLSSIGPNAGGMASRHQHSNQLPATSRSAVQGLIRTAYSYSAVSPSCTLRHVAVRHALSLALPSCPTACASLSPYLSVSWPQVKGRATAHTQIVENALEGTTVGIQAADPEDFEPDAIAAKLTKALGSPVTL